MKHDPINHHRRHIIRGGSGRGCSARGLDVSDKQFLKMADVFRNEMRVVGDSNNMIADDVGIIIGCYSGDMMAEYVLHSINSHDELVSEKERLRTAIECATNHFPGAAKMVAHEGWQLVPVEPTSAMLIASGSTAPRYRSMLAAAPKLGGE